MRAPNDLTKKFTHLFCKSITVILGILPDTANYELWCAFVEEKAPSLGKDFGIQAIFALLVWQMRCTCIQRHSQNTWNLI